MIYFEAKPTEKAGAAGLAASGAAARASCVSATQQMIESVAAVSAAREHCEILATENMAETSRLAGSGRAGGFLSVGQSRQRVARTVSGTDSTISHRLERCRRNRLLTPFGRRVEWD